LKFCTYFGPHVGYLGPRCSPFDEWISLQIGSELDAARIADMLHSSSKLDGYAHASTQSHDQNAPLILGKWWN